MEILLLAVWIQIGIGVIIGSDTAEEEPADEIMRYLIGLFAWPMVLATLVYKALHERSKAS